MTGPDPFLGPDFDPDRGYDPDYPPRQHPMSRRIVAGVAIAALVLSAIGVGLAIAHAQFGPPPTHVEQQDGLPA